MIKNKKLAIHPPKLPPQELFVDLRKMGLKDGHEYSNLTSSDSNLSNRTVHMVLVDCIQLNHDALCGSVVSNCQFNDVVIEGCDLSNTQWIAIKVNRAQIRNCKLTGLAMHDSRLSNAVFENCVGDLLQISSTEFKQSAFKNCQFTKADFRACDLEGSHFIDCDLSEALFYDAKLNDTDFRGSQLSGIKAFPKDLKGAIIDQQQAFELATHLAKLIGLQVKTQREATPEKT